MVAGDFKLNTIGYAISTYHIQNGEESYKESSCGENVSRTLLPNEKSIIDYLLNSTPEQ